MDPKFEKTPVPLLALLLIKTMDTPQFHNPRIDVPRLNNFSVVSMNIYMISLASEIISFDRKSNLGVSHSSTKAPEVCFVTMNYEQIILKRATTSNQL